MKLITKRPTQSLSETVGQQITNTNNISILDLDKESIINLYQSHGLLLFRGFEKDVDTFTKFTNELLNEIAERITAEINWQKGDILMVDNTRIMHGRRAFMDDKRDIYIRLCSPAFPC